MRIPNKFNGYSQDGIRLYSDPATAAAVAASSTTTMAGTAAATTALSSGLTAGAVLAGGASLPGIVGGLGALAPAAGGTALSALTPAVASSIAPAAAAQATQTIGLDALKNQIISQGMQNTAATQAANLANASTLGNASTLSNVGNLGLEQQLAQISSNPTNLSQFPRYETLADATGKTLVEKTATSPLPSSYEALNNISQTTADQIAKSNAANIKAMQGSPIKPGANFLSNAGNFFSNPSWQAAKDYASEHPYATSAGVYSLYQQMKPEAKRIPEEKALIRPYKFDRSQREDAYRDSSSGSGERLYFNDRYTALDPYRAPGPEYKAAGGVTSLAVGGQIETLSAENAVGQNFSYPQAEIDAPMYSNPMAQRPMTVDVINQGLDSSVDPYTGEQRFAAGGFAAGGFNSNDPMGNNQGMGGGIMQRAANPDEGMGYSYSYDPITQRFTQLSEPTFTPNVPVGQGMGMGGYNMYQQPTPKPKPFTPVVTGGIDKPFVQNTGSGATPPPPMNIPAYQTPEEQLGLGGFYDYMDQQLGGMRGQQGMAMGGLSTLGGYSDGGRLLRGPGDGVSDSIPASIGNRQPARLADGEFVVPARIVSEIGNGSTEAGARKLYAMMNRVQSARKKSVGKGKVAVNSKADKYLPA
jgi:hypothetical protein